MWRWIALGVVGVAVLVFGFSLIDSSGAGNVTASAQFIPVNQPIDGFARAIDPYDWQFPQDFGAHPEFQTEWWYYTGNVQTARQRPDRRRSALRLPIHLVPPRHQPDRNHQ